MHVANARAVNLALNGYARYEQGRSIPTVGRLSLLLSAVAHGGGFVINESHGRRMPDRR